MVAGVAGGHGHGRAGGVGVPMPVGMVVALGVTGAGQQAHADGGQQQAAGQAEPGIDALGCDGPGRAACA